MKLIDFYAVQSMLRPGQDLRLTVETESSNAIEVVAEITVYHFAEAVTTLPQMLSLAPGKQRHELTWRPPEGAPRGYGIALRLLDAQGQVLADGITAVDVLHDWTEYPRYGFLTDFAPGRADARKTAASLARYHINGLQFYDWQFRHDQLLPPTEQFIDPLGRSLSMIAVRQLLDAAHEVGIAGMPYLAIYGASLMYAQAHPQQALYDEAGCPLTFEGFLGLMDPTAGGAWATHLLAQCEETLAALSFDGLHVDQYGEPKKAYNALGEAVDLPAAFVDFMAVLKGAHPQKTAVFNAVGNWPIDALASGPQDFLYIEIWPPATGYRDVWDIISGARRKSGGKPVVIALYLAAQHEANIRLADALILSAGATRIEIGEQDRLLSDPYFPKHQPLSASLHDALRRYADFAVRYGEWLGPAATDLDPVCANGPAGVWAIPRRAGEWYIVNLVNVMGLGDRPSWDQGHAYPTPQTAVAVTVEVDGLVEEAYWASPDGGQLHLAPLTWRQEGRLVHVELPDLTVWSLLALHLDESYE